MDVKLGCCWRCEKLLPNKREPCEMCKIAVYCSTECLKRDEARHGSVECKMWSPINKCDACGRIGRVKECSGCFSAWYCDRICQAYAWKTHQKACDQWKQRALAVAERRHTVLLTDRPLVSHILEYPYYFGNTMAVDLLKLPSNPDIPCEEGEENAITQDFSLRLAGCGDLRNVTQTIYDLPEAYAGKLRFLLNDVDPFVMARNVLLLYMMAVFVDEITIANIWLSSRLSRKCFKHLQSSLDVLIASDSKTLKDLTNGAVLLDDQMVVSWHKSGKSGGKCGVD
ncbi:Zinc finger MYND domain-containing protein 10 [Holothuria leucospilota]|uniref:Zinc finger MYND domain-containing protein 10 n=1 Tax=Holothuria leucospilota TaxID=206669 RepID=A0A9Q1BMY2_HOLLE|nr:Zinc finger MYND domain-containing protein 10 [Holothuria leucospilota]